MTLGDYYMCSGGLYNGKYQVGLALATSLHRAAVANRFQARWGKITVTEDVKRGFGGEIIPIDLESVWMDAIPLSDSGGGCFSHRWCFDRVGPWIRVSIVRFVFFRECVN